jgi:hypothetical protein
MQLDSPSSAGRRQAAANKARSKRRGGMRFNPKAILDNSQVRQVPSKKRKK